MIKNNSSTISRYFMALSLSVIGVILSIIFLKPKGLENESINSEPIANLVDLVNQVEVRPAGAITWTSKKVGDVLYRGEMLRTIEGSSAKILFEGDNSYLEVEEKTILLIDKQNEKFSLNVIEGGLFLEKNKDSKEVIELSSDGKKVSLENGSLNLKKKNGQALNFNLLKGNAKAISKDKVLDIKEGSKVTIGDAISLKEISLNIEYPKYGQSLFLKRNEKFKIGWKNLSGLKDVQILMGKTEDSLSPIKANKGNKDDLEVKLNPGTYFWKINGTKGAKAISSLVYKNTINFITAAKKISPRSNDSLSTLKQKSEILFEFQLPLRTKENYIVIASDANFNNVLHRSIVKGNQFSLKNKITTSGNYFWKIESFFTNRVLAVETKIDQFKVKVTDVYPPELLFPLDGEVIYSKSSFQKEFEWKKINGITKYQVNVKRNKKNYLTKLVNKNSVFLKISKQGNYEWTVDSVAKNKISKSSDFRRFKVLETPVLKINEFTRINELITGFPLSLNWKGLGDEVSFYRLTFKLEDEVVLDTKVTNSSYAFEAKRVGTYLFKIRAFDKNSKIIAESIEDTIIFKTPKIPSAPALINPERPIVANSDGSVTLRVKEERFTKENEVIIKNLSGNTIYRERLGSSTFEVKDLLPGNYKVQTLTHDIYNRVSKPSSSINLKVPDLSNLKAPSLKALKVK